MRGLGRAGITVVASSPVAWGAGLWSRFATVRHRSPDVLTSPADAVEAIANAAELHGPFVVYPGREQAIDALFAARARLPGNVVLPYPASHVVLGLREKARIPEIAARGGLSAAETIAHGMPDELRARGLEPPFVVKPAYPGTVLGSARVVESRRDWLALLDELPVDEGLLVQEHVRGALVSAELVLDRDGNTVSRFQQRVFRTWPRAAGGIVLSVSVEPDQDLLERVRTMLAASGYWGLMQTQLLETERGHVVIDLNPRFYGPLPLALACGANLPAAWHRVALGQRGERLRPYRLGVTYRRVDADVTAALRGSAGALLQRTPAPRAGGFWARDDPLPSILLTVEANAKRAWHRVPRRLQRLASRSA
jgi:predicted ATP-grasp superfamily ATP-dependent carboligase